MTDRDHIEKLVATHKRYLQVLEEQRASFGQYCPPHLITGIEDTRAEIARLEAQLGGGAPAEAQSNLPRLPYFFGREDELAQIAEVLAPDARGWGMLSDGLGGIGKTALAIHAAHQASPELFPRKIFLTAKVRELTSGGEQPLSDFTAPDYMALLTDLGRELGDDAIGKSDPAERPRLVRERLARERALLVIDNLETLREDERTRLFQFLDRLPLMCKALVTSRRRADINARSLRLDRLSRAAGLELIGELARGNALLARPLKRPLISTQHKASRVWMWWVCLVHGPDPSGFGDRWGNNDNVAIRVKPPMAPWARKPRPRRPQCRSSPVIVNHRGHRGRGNRAPTSDDGDVLRCDHQISAFVRVLFPLCVSPAHSFLTNGREYLTI